MVWRLQPCRIWLVAGRWFDNFEIRTGNFPLLTLNGLDARIGSYRNRPVQTIVGHEHSVLLQAIQNRLDLSKRCELRLKVLTYNVLILLRVEVF
jgi:hypothetical protein